MKLNTLKRQELNARLRERYPATHATHIAFAGCTITVRTNSARLSASLDHYFNAFLEQEDGKAMIEITAHEGQPPELVEPFIVKMPDPGKTKIKEEFLDLEDGRVVRKRVTGMVFIFGGQDFLAVGPCLANINQVINFVNNRFIDWKLKQEYLLLHAAGVKLGGSGLALAGFSGMGKSTLALHLMSRGTNFISNDRLLAKNHDHEITMYGVAKLPRINPGTALNNKDLRDVIPADEAARFAALPPEKLWDLEHKYDVYIDKIYGPGRFELDAPMKGLVVLNWRRNAEKTVVREVSLPDRRDLLPAFMKSTGLFFLPEGAAHVIDHSPDNYVAMLSKCKVMEISGGVDFDIAAAACLHFLQQA